MIVILSGVRAGTLEPLVLVRCDGRWLRWIATEQWARVGGKPQATFAEALTAGQEAA